MFDIYKSIKEPPVNKPLKVQRTGGEYDGRSKFKSQCEEMQVHITGQKHLLPIMI